MMNDNAMLASPSAPPAPPADLASRLAALDADSIETLQTGISPEAAEVLLSLVPELDSVFGAGEEPAVDDEMETPSPAPRPMPGLPPPPTPGKPPSPLSRF